MSSDSRVRVVLDLFDEHREAVVRFARRSVDPSTAEDIAQEVFARLLRLPDIATREIRPGYLIKIAENLIRRRYERERRFADAAFQIAGRRADASSTPSETGRDVTSVHPDHGDRALDAVASLADRERDAVELVVGRGLSYREAAASMGVKVSDVNNWRHRGVEKMRRAAQTEEPRRLRLEGGH